MTDHNITLDLIKTSPNLINSINESKIVNIIVAKLQLIPQVNKLSKSIDLILFVCNAIENLTFELRLKKEKGFKLKIAIEIYEKVFSISVPDKEVLINCIEHLHSTKRIDRVKAFKKLKFYASNFFLRMLIPKND